MVERIRLLLLLLAIEASHVDSRRWNHRTVHHRDSDGRRKMSNDAIAFASRSELRVEPSRTSRKSAIFEKAHGCWKSERQCQRP